MHHFAEPALCVRLAIIAEFIFLQMREEGAGALFRGLTPVMIRAFPANAVSLKSWFTRRHNGNHIDRHNQQNVRTVTFIKTFSFSNNYDCDNDVMLHV